jgi:hypothetical protein
MSEFYHYSYCVIFFLYDKYGCIRNNYFRFNLAMLMDSVANGRVPLTILVIMLQIMDQRREKPANIRVSQTYFLH